MLDSRSQDLIKLQLEVQQNKIHLREVSTSSRMLNKLPPWLSIVEVNACPLRLPKLL